MERKIPITPGYTAPNDNKATPLLTQYKAGYDAGRQDSVTKNGYWFGVIVGMLALLGMLWLADLAK